VPRDDLELAAHLRKQVYNLAKIEDFDGNYTAVSAGATVAGGGSATAMQNQNGVVIKMHSTNQGL
jgi:hypothetical protein